MSQPVSSILNVTAWISRSGGGIPPVVWAQAREYRRLGVECLVVGLDDEFVAEDCQTRGLPFLAGRIVGPRSFGFSPELRGLIQKRVVPEGGIIHSHGLWMYPGALARNLARQMGYPLVLSPHGMLEPWALRNSRWKKRVAAWLFEHRNLQSADCLHALTETEARQLRTMGLRNPIAVIPNGIAMEDFSPLPDYRAIESVHPFLHGRRRVLFMSRIHPKKGLPNLLRAWQRIIRDFGDWTLLIAGQDQLGHRAEMESLAAELQLGNSVFFLGPISGETKRKVLAGADAFVLPSLSEGFTMAALEAAACGLPVLMTPQCNFPELTVAAGAIEAQPETGSLEEGLRRMLGLSNAKRKEMGARGRRLVGDSYTWREIVARLVGVYSWLLGCGATPDCVKLN